MPSQTVSIQNGLMDIWLHTVNGVHEVATVAPQLDGSGSEGGQLYGRYAIRFRADPVPGYKTAWLLWPDSENWPYDGEIDFPEGGLDSTINAYMHYQGATGDGSQQDAYTVPSSTYNTWHTAVIEWLPTSLKFYLDGNLIGDSTTNIPDTPMHWALQNETDLTSTPPSDSASGHIQIDWVAAYAPA